MGLMSGLCGVKMMSHAPWATLSQSEADDSIVILKFASVTGKEKPGNCIDLIVFPVEKILMSAIIVH